MESKGNILVCECYFVLGCFIFVLGNVKVLCSLVALSALSEK